MSFLLGFDRQPHLSVAGFDAMARFVADELPPDGPATLAPRHDMQTPVDSGPDIPGQAYPPRTFGGVR